MPTASRRPCCKPGCSGFAVAYGYCDQHQAARRQGDQRRGSANDRGYGHKWRVDSREFRAENPLCVHCLAVNRISAATVVDHVVPHKGDMRLFWDRSNWQALCETCHNRKTATEDKGTWLPPVVKAAGDRG